MKLKPVEEVVTCVVDYGTCICLAVALGRTMKKVYYFSPVEREYVTVREEAVGGGVAGIERVDDFWPLLDEIDLFVFPDIGFGGLQKHLRSLGKAVWGHMGADELELSRTFFLDVLEEVGLPIVRSERIVGLNDLASYLKGHHDKWIKIDKFRGNMETWHHLDYAHSQRRLESLAVALGGTRELVTFVAQDAIDAELEIGYDGWCIDGRFPTASLQGYEKKNKLYLGSVLTASDLPDEVRYVNEAMAPVWERYGYRNWLSTEIRVAKGVPYFIDPSTRAAGLTSESQPEILVNFADVIWNGANGNLIVPEFKHTFVAEACLEYDSDESAEKIEGEWKVLVLPLDVQRWVKLSYYCEIDGIVNLIPNDKEETGVLVGVGDSTEAAIAHLKGTIKKLDGLPVHADTKDFVDLIEEIEEAEKKGIAFGGRLPRKESVL